MTTAGSKQERISVEEYLAREEQAATRHEYVDGQVFAMSGVKRRHNQIAMNIQSLIRAHLKGSCCRVYIAELKVHVKAMNSFYYPDVVVTCGKFDDDSWVIDDPSLIVEVLSRSTANVDRREKMVAYRCIPSLREYLIVDYKRKSVTMYRRDSLNEWESIRFQGNDEIELTSMAAGILKVHLGDFYEDTDLQHQSFEFREDSEEYEIDDEDDEREDEDDEWEDED